MLSPWTTWEDVVRRKIAKERINRTYHATNTQKPHYDQHRLRQLSHITSQLSIAPLDRVHELDRDIQVKDGRHTHGSKEAHENSLAVLLDLWDFLVDGKHPGESSKEQDQDAKGHEAIERDHIVDEELVPGAHSTVPHEDGHVQKHIDGGLEGVVESLEAEPIIPSERVASDEAGEDTRTRCINSTPPFAGRTEHEIVAGQ